MRDDSKHSAHPAEEATRSGDLDLFASAGDGLTRDHFGIAEDGRAFVIAGPFARALGHRDGANATRLLDVEEKGTQIVSTPGGQQKVTVIFEDGIWELIFRSTLPSAKSIKSRVKAILRQLRETGVVDVRGGAAELPQDYETALVHLLDQVRARKALEAKVAEDAPKVAAWEAFLDRDGWLQVGDIARVLGWGRNTLFARLRNEGVLLKQPWNAPCADWVKNGWACVRPNGHVSQRGEEGTTTLISGEGAARIERILSRNQLGAA